MSAAGFAGCLQHSKASVGCFVLDWQQPSEMFGAEAFAIGTARVSIERI